MAENHDILITSYLRDLSIIENFFHGNKITSYQPPVSLKTTKKSGINEKAVSVQPPVLQKTAQKKITEKKAALPAPPIPLKIATTKSPRNKTQKLFSEPKKSFSKNKIISSQGIICSA
jgi:hypothetical protein